MIDAMVPTLEAFWAAAAVHLWQSTLVLAALALLGLSLRSAPARVHHVLWWLALVKFFLPLSLLGPLALNALSPAIPTWLRGAAPFDVVERVVVVLDPSAWKVMPQAFESGRGGWLYLALTAFWLVGVSLLLLRQIKPRSIRDRVDELSLERAPTILREKLRSALEATEIPELRVRLTRSNVGPYVVGAARARIVIPLRVAEKLSVEELRAVLLHEECHRRRHDPLLAGLRRLAATCWFFYPPVWWVAARIRRSAELACDESVLERGIRPAVYARALARTVGLGLNDLPFAADTSFGGPLLTERMRRIGRPGRYAVLIRHRLALAVAAALVLFVSFVPMALVASERPASAVSEAEDAYPRAAALDRIQGLDFVVPWKSEKPDLQQALRSIEAGAGIEIRVVGPDDAPLTVRASPGSTARQTLERLAWQHGLVYEAQDARTLIVRRPWIPGVNGVKVPRVIERSMPVYPEDARVARAEGKVMLQAVIRRDGSVGRIVPIKEVPEFPSLTQSAVEAVGQWRYEPSTRDGKPVEVLFTVILEFALHDNPPQGEDEDEDDAPDPI